MLIKLDIFRCKNGVSVVSMGVGLLMAIQKLFFSILDRRHGSWMPGNMRFEFIQIVNNFSVLVVGEVPYWSALL